MRSDMRIEKIKYKIDHFHCVGNFNVRSFDKWNGQMNVKIHFSFYTFLGCVRVWVCVRWDSGMSGKCRHEMAFAFVLSRKLFVVGNFFIFCVILHARIELFLTRRRHSQVSIRWRTWKLTIKRQHKFNLFAFFFLTLRSHTDDCTLQTAHTLRFVAVRCMVFGCFFIIILCFALLVANICAIIAWHIRAISQHIWCPPTVCMLALLLLLLLLWNCDTAKWLVLLLTEREKYIIVMITCRNWNVAPCTRFAWANVARTHSPLITVITFAHF